MWLTSDPSISVTEQTLTWELYLHYIAFNLPCLFTAASRLVDHFLKASGSESNQNSRQNSPRPIASEASTEEEASASDYSSGLCRL